MLLGECNDEVESFVDQINEVLMELEIKLCD